MRRVDQTPKQLAERIKSREEEATCSQGLGSRATAVYRAHLINTDDHIQASKVIKAESDESALEIAKQYVDGCDVELGIATGRLPA
jgi:hypothetical protein